MPFANVRLMQSADSVFVQGEVTDINGSFTISPPDGSYFLQVTLIGYADWFSKSFEIGVNSNYSFEDIVLEEDVIALDGVEVTAQKLLIEENAEGTVVNVGTSIMTQGSSALQLLQGSPGVIVDERDNNVLLNGQTGTLVMINGKRVRMSTSELVTFLSGMSADNVDKIELLTNPGAKYDAEGGGIINLVLKRDDRQGTNGTLSLSAGYGHGQKETVSLNLSHREEKMAYYGSYSFSQ